MKEYGNSVLSAKTEVLTSVTSLGRVGSFE